MTRTVELVFPDTGSLQAAALAAVALILALAVTRSVPGSMSACATT